MEKGHRESAARKETDQPDGAARRPGAKVPSRPERPPLTIGGQAVDAGTRAAIALPITDLSTHTPITMPVQIVHGRREGPRLFVCAALHGDEINGVEIIRRLLKLSALGRLRGTLIAVPIVNVPGFLSLSRYLPDRRDLNRSFPGSPTGSLAARLARLFLDEIACNSTHGIDLHTGAIHRTNFPQIRGNLDDPEVDRLARAFGVPVVINTGFREGSLREAAARAKVSVMVYEAGEALRFDESCIRAGVKGVVRVMRALGMLPPRKGRGTGNTREPLVIRSSRWIRAPQSGMLRATLGLGSQVREGQVLGLVADPFGGHEMAVVSGAEGIVIGRTNLPLVHEGDALFHVAHYSGTQVAARSLEAFEPEAEYEVGLTSELTGDPPIV